MRAVDGYYLNNAAAGTYTFTLSGGMYAWATSSTGTGTIDFKLVDNAGTAHAVATQITATAGFQTGINLPPGTYEVVIATFTANYVGITRVPGE